jgi:hypothetical protein
MIGGISFSATSITSGLDVYKPVSPKPGHQYLATDTKILYVCYEAGTWVNASPPTPDLIVVTLGTTYTLKSINEEKLVTINAGAWQTLYDFTVTELKNVSAVSSFRFEFEGKSAISSYTYRVRLLINDEVIGSDYGNNTGYNTKVVNSTTPLNIGDNVKIQGTIESSGVPGQLGIRNIKLQGDIKPEIVTQTETGFIEPI